MIVVGLPHEFCDHFKESKNGIGHLTITRREFWDGKKCTIYETVPINDIIFFTHVAVLQSASSLHVLEFFDKHPVPVVQRVCTNYQDND